ncbi:hypothetical protein DFH07DRAFT_396972 [Mycena maculata]|uniref:F-box domain-containing protein n=1 Tax=Mycena maculata TaxID=230809 RepID=A0AAD7JF91_9AGAR|nr:hypothetical protein DFH07DRAFT_396972 [Mycena maculata]
MLGLHNPDLAETPADSFESIEQGYGDLNRTVSHLFETNNPPTEIELSALRDLVSHGNARKAQLNAAIAAALQPISSVAELITEWDALDEQLLKCKAALAPIRSMPTELLSLVFSFALLVPCDTLHADPPLWTLGQVCRRWRTILLSQPIFWAKVDLDFALRADETKFRLQTQLQRSGALPLDIDLLCDDDKSFTAHEQRLTRILAASSRRWERVSLYGHYSLYDYLDRVRDRLPLLRELHIMLRSPGHGNYTLNIFQSAPKLRHVFINMGYSTAPLTVILPFEQLLRFGGSNSWEGHLNTLGSACNLVDCALEICSTAATPASRIVLPHLLRLSLTNSAFLACLETPVLEDLYCPGPTLALASFLERLPSKLRKLFMHGSDSVHQSPFDIPPILQAAPTISHLGIRILKHAEDLLSDLTRIITSLETITIDLEDCDGFDDAGRYVAMVESQWRAGRLRTVHICSSDSFFSMPSWERMERLRGEGMEISWYSRTQLLLDLTPPHLHVLYAKI